jgi:hypothetical protein
MMISISKIDKYIIHYNCSCGVIGECMFKPPEKSSIILIDIECPMCGSEDRVKLMKYVSDDDKKLSEDSFDFYWAAVIDNKVLEV